jgi:hypothetical protein
MLLLAATVALAGSGALAVVPEAGGWLIGPIIKGKNYSRGMPLRPAESRRGLFEIDLPRAPGSVHYVTFRHGSLQGKRRIVLRYRLEAAPGVKVVATTSPKSPGLITPYFQRSGDNWSARGPFETYRWYATFATQKLSPGEFEIIAPLNARWTAIQASNAQSAPQAFRAAVANAGEVGFVLGGGDGYGHGVHATGPARLIITDFRVE